MRIAIYSIAHASKNNIAATLNAQFLLKYEKYHSNYENILKHICKYNISLKNIIFHSFLAMQIQFVRVACVWGVWTIEHLYPYHQLIIKILFFLFLFFTR